MSRASSLARVEREALAASLLRLGPQAPTILPDWDARDLLVHLLQREGAPQVMLGSALPVAALRDRAQAAEARLRERPWPELTERFASGPPRFSPFQLVDTQANGIEYLVHHEDLLRAQPDWRPRTLTPQLEAEALRRLRPLARVMVRVPVEVILLSAHGSIRVPTRSPQGTVRVTGSATELALWAFGRDQHARVAVDGSPEAVTALASGTRGI